MPDRPGAWLTTTAWRKALDRLRHEQRRRRPRRPTWRQPVSYDLELEFDRSSLEDDQLRMLFTCCHPALRAGGADGADAAQRRRASRCRRSRARSCRARARWSGGSTRARRKITDARIPFRGAARRPAGRSGSAGVLRVVYLVFTEGHMATRGEAPVRGDLCEEAIRLARLLVRLMPDEAEALGLLALLLLTDARRPARVVGGELVALARPGPLALGRRADRARASPCSIARCGCGARARTLIQAAIAGAARPGPGVGGHRLGADRRPLRRARAPRPLAGGDGQPRGRGRLRRRARRPAWPMLDGAAADARLARYQPLHAARAELLRRAGDAGGGRRVRPRDRAVGQRGRARRAGAPAACPVS